MKMLLFATFSLILSIPATQACRYCNENCGTGDCISFDVSQQTKCYEFSEQPPTSQCEWWGNGLSAQTDFQLLGGKVIAYKLRWFSGSWSGWFVPGMNDMDCKYNTEATQCKGKEVCAGSLRRWWSYFYDHTHTYIICK